MASEKLNTHTSEFIRIMFIYLEGKGWRVSPLSIPPRFPQGLVVLMKYWLMVLKQVFIRNRPKNVFLLYLFFLIRSFGEVKNLFFFGEIFIFILNTFKPFYLKLAYITVKSRNTRYPNARNSYRS